jgi:hypothetical protein
MQIARVTWATADLDADARLGGEQLQVRVQPGAPALLAVGIGEQQLP